MTTYVEYEAGEEKIIATMDVKDLLNVHMKANDESVQDIVHAEFLPDWYSDDTLDDDVWIGSWEDVLRLEVLVRSADTMEEAEWQAAREYIDFAHMPIIAVWTKNHLYTSENIEKDRRGEITVKKLRRKINFSESNEPIFDDYATWKTVVPQADEE